MRSPSSGDFDRSLVAQVVGLALPWLWAGLLVLGGVLAVVGALLVALGVHRARSGPAGPVYPQYAAPPGPVVPPPSPRPAPADAPQVGTTPGSER
jgi:hypothetical protein